MRNQIAIAALLGAACGTAPTAIRLDEDFQLSLGRTVVLPGNTAQLSFQAVKEDSRCPGGAMCVWAGSAPVVLRFQKSTIDTVATLDAAQEARELVAGGYRIEIRELKPHPQVGQSFPKSDYCLVVRASILKL